MNVNSLPRQKFGQTQRPGKPTWMIGEQQAQMPSQEWVTSPVQGKPQRVVEFHVPVRKIIAGLAIFLGAMIMLGLGASIGSQTPDSTTVATLHYAQSHAPAGVNCGAVWQDGADHWAVECGSIGQ